MRPRRGARGTCENAIKAVTCDLHSDRTSATTFLANALRLLFKSLSAGRAMQTGIDHTTDTNMITWLEPSEAEALRLSQFLCPTNGEKLSDYSYGAWPTYLFVQSTPSWADGALDGSFSMPAPAAKLRTFCHPATLIVPQAGMALATIA